MPTIRLCAVSGHSGEHTADQVSEDRRSYPLIHINEFVAKTIQLTFVRGPIDVINPYDAVTARW